jgi:hypothetical protein
VEPKHPGRNGQRSLWAAEGVLVGLRRCSLDEAFMEIVTTAKRHNVAPLGLADALVAIAENDPTQSSDDDAIAAARRAWGALLGLPCDNTAPAPYLPGAAAGTECKL